MTTLQNFKHCEWMYDEVRRIGQARFDKPYWISLEQALEDCLESHSFVSIDPDKDKTLSGFVLVCPNDSASAESYKLNSLFQNHLEIAFVAIDSFWEGKGLARRMLSEVLLCCKTTHQGCWLHVDTVNPRARGLYDSLGFSTFITMPDPFGSMGDLMVWYPYTNSLQLWAEILWYAHMEKRTTLLDSSPCQTKQPLCGSVLSPPRVTSQRHGLPFFA